MMGLLLGDMWSFFLGLYKWISQDFLIEIRSPKTWCSLGASCFGCGILATGKLSFSLSPEFDVAFLHLILLKTIETDTVDNNVLHEI
ncbi:hypothetical protein VNO77_43804 [Canavalia gladiata]|uniref:Uncharacterized protein n=1 Tax=Canavalia gladiata TaxID=3824 RepID=A0AAN9JVH1_CANGL